MRFPRYFLKSKKVLFLPIMVALLLAVACGASATATPLPTNTPVPAAPEPTDAPAVVVPPTEAPMPTQASAGLAKPVLQAAPIDTDRSRVPTGKITEAVHTSISTVWLDPLRYPQSAMVYTMGWKLHDAVCRSYPDVLYGLGLAESFEASDDLKSVTFKLRPDLKFHNGEDLTTEDVLFTFENYQGANGQRLKDAVSSIDVTDDLTITFNFHKAFAGDFVDLYCTAMSHAAWIVPKDYYESVGGHEGFVKAPIGAGPFTFVRQEPGISVDFKAWTDYWRTIPFVDELTTIGIRELAVRAAALQTGDVDFAMFMTGELLRTVLDDPDIMVDPNNSAPFWLMFPDMDDPDSPFADKRVRQAISLAMDRPFLSMQETQGLAIPWGSYIPPDWPGAFLRDPDPFDLDQAKALMAEAGYADGFEIDWFTPFPAVESLSLRVMDELREIGIDSQMNVMERPVYMEKLNEGKPETGYGHNGFPGRQIVMAISVIPGPSSQYVDAWATCDGTNSLICLPEIEALWSKFLDSEDPAVREQASKDAQQFLLEEYIFVPIYVNAFALGIGPRIAGERTEYTRIAMMVLPGLPETYRLKPGE